jgi:hypothetical protein
MPVGASIAQPLCAMTPNEYTRRDRTTDAPLAVDLSQGLSSSTMANLANRMRIPASWVGMSGYLIAGIFLGLILILALSIGRGEAAAASPAPATVTDNIVRLHARDIGNSCWTDYQMVGPARLTVALEVGIDGKIRYAAASGGTPAMRGCVEAHVKSWEFLPQSQAQTMALPFEVDRR